MDWHRIDQGFAARKDGDEGEASSGDIEATGAIARMKAPTDPRAEPWPPMQTGTGL